MNMNISYLQHKTIERATCIMFEVLWGHIINNESIFMPADALAPSSMGHPNVSVKLGEVKLKRVQRCKHVGVTLCSENITEKDIIAEKIGEGRAPLMAARGLGAAQSLCPRLCYLNCTGVYL